jgi:hypothetical protein
MQNSLGFSPVDRPGDIRPRRPDDSTLNPLSRPSSQKKTQFYGDIRESLPQRIATLRPDRQNGGRGGIRTPDTLSGTPVFKTGAINHSATLPVRSLVCDGHVAQKNIGRRNFRLRLDVALTIRQSRT